MEKLTPLSDKGSSPANSFAKMNTIIFNQQTFINDILQALISCNPQNSQFTNQITKIQKDYQKCIEENNLKENSPEALNSSFENFIESAESNFASIKINIDQINIQGIENREVITSLGANLQSLRDDFELFKMKKSTPTSPRKKNELLADADIEQIKSDVDSLKSALHIINENYASHEDLQNCLEEVNKLHEISQKVESTASSFSRFTKDQQATNQKIESQLMTIQKEDVQGQINQIKSDQSSKESQIHQTLNQVSGLQNQLNELKNLTIQTRGITLQENDLKISQINKKLDDLSISQAKTSESVNELSSNLDEQINKCSYPLINRVSKIEEKLTKDEEQLAKIEKLNSRIDSIENYNSQNPILDKEAILNIPEISSIKQEISKLANQQNKTTETVNSLSSKFNEHETNNTNSRNEIERINGRLSEIENNNSQGQILGQSEISSIKQRIDELTISQNQAIETANSIQTKFEELETNISPHITEIERQLNQVKQTSPNFSQMNERLAELTNSQNKTIETVNSIQNKYDEFETNISPHITEIERQLNQVKQTSPNFSQMSERLAELTNSQNKTIETVDSIKAKYEELEANISSHITQLERQLNQDKQTSPNFSQMSERLAELTISQNKTIETVNSMRSKLEEHEAKYSLPLTGRVAEIQEQLDQIEITSQSASIIPDDAECRISFLEEKAAELDSEDIRRRMNEIISSQNKTIETVNSMRTKFEENELKYSIPLTNRTQKIEEQLNDIDELFERIEKIESNGSQGQFLDEEAILSLPDISAVRHRVDELSASQNMTIETVNSLKAKLMEHEAKYTNPLLDRVCDIEEQLKEPPKDDEVEELRQIINGLQDQLDTISQQSQSPSVQEREIKLIDHQTEDEISDLRSCVESLADDLKSAKSALKSLDDQNSALKGQISQIMFKLSSLESAKEKQKYELPSFSSDDDGENGDIEDDGGSSPKLRRRVSKLEKIVARLLSTEKLNMKMIPIDFDEEIDLSNETGDETLRRHNHEISVLAKDFIVLSNEVIDLQCDVTELKLNRKNCSNGESDEAAAVDDDRLESLRQKVEDLNRLFTSHVSRQESERSVNLSEIQNDELNGNLAALKTRVDELSSSAVKLHSMNNALTSHVKSNTSSISSILARLGQLEEQSDHGKRVRKVRKHHHRSRRKQFEEEEDVGNSDEATENEQSQTNNENESEEAQSNQRQTAEIAKRLDQLAGAAVKFSAAVEAIKSHLTRQQNEINVLSSQQREMQNESASCSSSETLKMMHDIRCIKFELRKHLKQQEDGVDSSEYAEALSRLQNQESRIADIASSVKKLIDNANSQTSYIRKCNEVINAIESTQEKNDEELIQTQNDIEQIKYELETLQNSSNSVSGNNEQQIENLQNDIKCIKYEMKKLKDKSNSYQENDEQQIKNLQNDIRCIKYEMKKMMNKSSNDSIQPAAVTERGVDINDTQIETIENRLSEIENQINNLQEIVNSKSGNNERSNDNQIMESRIADIASSVKKLIDNANSQTSYIRKCNEVINAIESTQEKNDEELIQTQNDIEQIKYELKTLQNSSNSVSGNNEQQIENLQNDIEQIKYEMKKLKDTSNSYQEYNTNSLANSSELQKLQHDMKCVKYELKKRDNGANYGQFANSLNQVISSQKLIVNNANSTRNCISEILHHMSLLESRFSEVNERLNLLETSQSPSASLSENDREMVKSLSRQIERITSSQSEIRDNLNEHSNLIQDVKLQMKGLKKRPTSSSEAAPPPEDIADIQDSIASLEESINSIKQRLSGNFIKITETYKKISNKFENISKEIKALKEKDKQQQLNDLQAQERGINLNGNDGKTVDLNYLVSEFMNFRKSQEKEIQNLKKQIEDSNENTSQQIQNAVKFVKNELNQSHSKSSNSNIQQNKQIFNGSEVNDLLALKLTEMRKDLNLLKNEQKKIQYSLSKSGNNQNDENSRSNDISFISSKVNQISNNLNNLSSQIQQNDQLLRNELTAKSDEIEKAKKLANEIVKIVKGHGKKLEKLKYMLDYHAGVLSEVSGKEIQRNFSVPTTPK